MKLKPVLFGGVAIAVTVFWYQYVNQPYVVGGEWPKEKFASEQWVAQAKNVRFKMAHDLIDSRQLDGKSLDHVKQMLGSPDYQDPQNGYWHYIVQDRDSGVGGSSAVALLTVYFDPGGRVSRVGLSHD